MYTTFDEMAGRPMTMATLADSKWLSRFLDETPGDSQIGGNSRQVPNACWSRVVPFCPPNPVLKLWSNDLAGTLNLEKLSLIHI